jgi:exo-beta-1,3-glucanase (GH17 family)
MQIITPYTNWIRSFSSSNGLENTPSVARQLGLNVAANAWISSDLAQNTVEINNVVAAANAGLVDVVIVGSEAILRNDVTVSQLIGYMNQVRQAIPQNIPVVTADVWGTFLAHPELIAASDQVWANFYPFWEGTSVENAVCSLAGEYQQLVGVSGSKPVVISETGWPSGGNAVGAAVPSVSNANLYADQFLTWANSNGIRSFYFEAFNEDWKTATEGPQGAYWGIFDENGVVKAGMDAYFNGQTASVSCNGILPGPVGIGFTYVPPYGSSDALEVQVSGVQPSKFVVATYIKVFGGWWTKPTFAMPTVSLNPDGTARIAIVTGGSDQLATDIAAFLIPSMCAPPSVGGGNLPSVPCAVASVQVSRTQSSISGTIMDTQNHPIVGAAISDSKLGTTKSAPDGKYCFYSIAQPGSATLIVTHPSYDFPTSPTTVSIPAGNLTLNFMGISAPVIPPTVNIDAPRPSATIFGTVNVGGWAIDNATRIGTLISSVQVSVDGAVLGNATYGVARPDVCGVLPGRPGCPNVGFNYALDTSTLSLGSHVIRVTAIDTDGAPDSGYAEVAVMVAVPPLVHIDAPANGSIIFGTVNVGGWAIDNNGSGSTAIGSVRVAVDGAVLGNATYGVARPDVCGVLPGRPGCPNVGFNYALDTSTLSLGSHVIRVTAIDIDGAPDSGFSEIAVMVAAPPLVHIDAPLNGSAISGLTNVGGWAVDNANGPGTAIASVQVSIDGVPVGSASYGFPRADVCAALPGRPGCPNVGFNYSLDSGKLSPGSHIIRVTAVDTDGAPDSGFAEIVVLKQTPATPATGTVTIPASPITPFALVSRGGTFGTLR